MIERVSSVICNSLNEAELGQLQHAKLFIYNTSIPTHQGVCLDGGGVERKEEIGFHEVLVFFFFFKFNGEDYIAKLEMNPSVCRFQRTPILDNTTR